ncbi:hypothetical protein V8E53_000262 [Lactarius tabidus]
MVDFNDPVVIEKDFLAVVKLWHVMDGIFIWEFFVTLDYEWSVIRGRRPYRRTIWLYSLTRVCTLITLILNILAFDSSAPINCQLWVIFELIFGTLAFAAASSLIVLRINAIWNRNRIAVAIAMCAWGANVAFLIHYISRVLSTWAPEQSVCVVLNTDIGVKNVITTLVSDVALLLTMLVGLLRLRRHGTVFALGQLLWKQGLVWLFAATVAEVPPSVFISLNLNGPFNLMFQTPGLVVMSIAATRMHRSLTDFFNESGPSSFDTHPTRGGHAENEDPKLISSTPVRLNQVLGVAVHTSSEDYPLAKLGQYVSNGLYGTDNQSQDKHLGLSIGSDLENGAQRGLAP